MGRAARSSHAEPACGGGAGDVVFMSSYALGRSPDIWQDPEQFRPVRRTAAAFASVAAGS
jgi:cytochrome P450